ncbi:MAG: hypothetical protein GX542_00125 [Rhodococcus sp.]|nr:hypothetical protein [Rhodococcus sp. (in: high G+C Gram-positive bacteria)]
MTAISVGVAPASADPASEFSVLCTPTDPALAELSGLVATTDQLYAIGDSGSDEFVAVLDSDCAVQRWIPVPVDPYDIEDMAYVDGELWLADIGDNRRQRSTVALIRVNLDDTSSGDDPGSLHRLTYPDGAHDAESILIGPDNVPIIVTKEFGGVSGVYRPKGGLTVHELAEPGPTALEKVGEVDVTAAGGSGPQSGGGLDSGHIADSLTRVIFTGGAVSHDGTIAAVRSYTHLHLYDLRGTTVSQALTAPPFEALLLPQQPQGEAVAFTADGHLVIASEARDGPLPPLLILDNAVSRLPTEPGTGAGVDAADPAAGRDSGPSVGLIAVALAGSFALLGGGMLLTRALRRQ